MQKLEGDGLVFIHAGGRKGEGSVLDIMGGLGNLLDGD